MTAAGRRRALLGAVFALAVLTHVNTLGNGFVWDDHELLRRADEIGTWRPVKRLTIQLDRALYGDAAWGYHLTNTLLHGSASALLAAIALAYTGAGGAVLAGLLFAVHPVHTEAVACVAHRKEMLAMVFVAATLLVARRAATRPALWPMAVVCYALALGSKEVAAVMTPLLVAGDLWLTGRLRMSRRRLAAAAATALLAAALASLVWLDGVARYVAPERLERLSEGEASSYAPFLKTAVASYAWDVRMLALPHPLYLDRRFPLARSWLDPRVLSGALVLAALVFAVYRFRRRGGIAFGLAWFGVTLLPVSGLLPLSHWRVAERFLYVPSAGLLLALGVIAGPYLETGRRRRWLWAATAAVVLVCVRLAIHRGSAWHDEQTLWQATLRHNPQSYRAWRQLGEARLDRGDTEGAKKALVRGLDLRPESSGSHFHLARALRASGDPAGAVAHARAAAEAVVDKPGPWILLAELHGEIGQPDAAITAYERALEHAPNAVAALYGVARLQVEARRYDDARAWLERLQTVAPEHAGGVALSGVVALRTGDAESAERLLRRAIALDPNAAAPHRYLAALLLLGGDLAQAERHLAEAHRLDPSLPPPDRVLDAYRAPR